MLALAWANLMHRKLRTALSALAVGLGIALMLISRGLASGSIAEVNQRMQSVDAELVILPAQDNIIFTSGAPFPGIFEGYIARQADDRGPLATAVIPVFFGQVRMGGQQQRVFGVDPGQMELFLGPRKVVAGQVFDRSRRLARRVAELRTILDQKNVHDELTEADLADGLELVIDDRLRQVGEGGAAYEIGDVVRLMGRDFRITGVVEAGVAGRVFVPIQTLRHMLNGGEPWSSMFFVKLRDHVDPLAAAEVFARALGSEARVELKSDYGRLLRESFAQVNQYLTASSGLALAVCFLFILLTMYTLVIERTREIGILKSLGVTRFGLVRLAVLEALMISVGGVVIGIGLAFLGRSLLAVIKPLLTVDLVASSLLLALGIGVIGGTLSALYPGYRAARLEPATALRYE